MKTGLHDALVQSQKEHQPQGDDELDIVSLQEEKEYDEKKQDVARVQVLQLQALEDAAQSSCLFLRRGAGFRGFWRRRRVPFRLGRGAGGRTVVLCDPGISVPIRYVTVIQSPRPLPF